MGGEKNDEGGDERRVLRAARIVLPLLPLPPPHNELVDPGTAVPAIPGPSRGAAAVRTLGRSRAQTDEVDPAPSLSSRAAGTGGWPGGRARADRVRHPRGDNTPARKSGRARGGLPARRRGELSDLAVYRRLMGDIAAGAEAAVIFVEYDRTPEAVFPSQLQQGLAVARFAVSKNGGARLGIDPSRVAVSGDSAGATLATVVALLLGAGFRRVPSDPVDISADALARRGDGGREKGSFPLVAHTMVNPVTSSELRTASMQEFAGGPWLSRTSMQWFWLLYLAGKPLGEPDALQSPVFAPRRLLAGLPPTLVILAQVDPLQDEGAQYARLVSDAGVPVVATRYDGPCTTRPCSTGT